MIPFSRAHTQTQGNLPQALVKYQVTEAIGVASDSTDDVGRT